jgi:hypothetical protein
LGPIFQRCLTSAAELSRLIFRSLERVVADPQAAGTRALLARRMHSRCSCARPQALQFVDHRNSAVCVSMTRVWFTESVTSTCRLPSFTEAYTASTPLTRIRDIAHRGDIPHELKQEIKHTIQNKLHRNAGPEDLVRSSTHHLCIRVGQCTPTEPQTHHQ